LGDATKAQQLLGWEPELSFDELVTKMAGHVLVEAKKEKLWVCCRLRRVICCEFWF
tara:strand:+ start:492 stop:659 length:168 start_codon:yes stop_codon:yes gene_type:complete